MNPEITENPEMEAPLRDAAASAEESNETRLWSWIRFGLVAFMLVLFYIYNSHHANKALRNKDQLIKDLKELHSEKISLESQVTNASKQTEVAKKLEETGVKELTQPPVKIEYQKAK